MNKLDPDLKRLLEWAREASASEIEAAPFGFPGRVLASRRLVQTPSLYQELQRAAWILTGASLVLILCGGIVLANQRPDPAPAAELPSALSFLASNLPR